MRGTPDSDKDARDRWDQSVAASKKLAKKGKGKIKGLLNKYLGSNIKDIIRDVDMIVSIPELEKLGDKVSTMKFTSSELKKLQVAVERKRKYLSR